MAASMTEIENTFIPTKQMAKMIKLNQTDILCSHFKDYDFIIVTQYQKLGSLVQVSQEIVLDEIHQATPVYSTKVLLGKDEPFTHVLAKNIISEMQINKPIILSMALKDTSIETVSVIKHLVKECVS
ncbi:proteasome assembly chaperone 3-like [Gigantopelta aegis]|uniref:proteasome assembly chaperone 3-like n=1 Tax=Gigantopelta aegis TaxID=1735272 RepID=UPI001B88BE91|nr:proteasome assembly chaperone 3-like [Gigantopelta aegis]